NHKEHKEHKARLTILLFVFFAFFVVNDNDQSKTASTSSSRMRRIWSSRDLYSSPAQLVNRMVSPSLTCSFWRRPSFSSRPGPTANTLPRWGLFLAVSGR